MNNSLKLLKRIVNLQGYGNSLYFIGYYESVPFGEWEKEATDLFVNFFSQKFDEAVLVCSVTQSVIKEDFLSNEERKYLGDMVSRGWIELNRQDEDIHERFRVYPLDNDDIQAVRSLCELIIKGHTYGHIFFVWEKDQLVVYILTRMSVSVFSLLREQRENPQDLIFSAKPPESDALKSA